MRAIVHFLTKGVAAARRALKKTEIPVQREQQVLIVQVENTAGAVAKILRRIADEGARVRSSYLAANNRLVIAVSSLRKAAPLSDGLGRIMI